MEKENIKISESNGIKGQGTFIRDLLKKQASNARKVLIETACEDPERTLGEILESLENDHSGEYVMLEIFKGVTVMEIYEGVRPKVEAGLDEAADLAPAETRQLSHPESSKKTKAGKPDAQLKHLNETDDGSMKTEDQVATIDPNIPHDFGEASSSRGKRATEFKKKKKTKSKAKTKAKAKATSKSKTKAMPPKDSSMEDWLKAKNSSTGVGVIDVDYQDEIISGLREMGAFESETAISSASIMEIVDPYSRDKVKLRVHLGDLLKRGVCLKFGKARGTTYALSEKDG